jgi:hypothetical protein
MVSFVHTLVSKRIRVVDTKILLKFNIGLSLLGRGNVSVVRIVEALLLKHFFDALYILYYFDRHLSIIWDVFVERNKFNPSDQINKVARRHLRNQLSIRDNHDENMTFYINDANNSLSGILYTAFFIKLFPHFIL